MAAASARTGPGPEQAIAFLHVRNGGLASSGSTWPWPEWPLPRCPGEPPSLSAVPASPRPSPRAAGEGPAASAPAPGPRPSEGRPLPLPPLRSCGIALLRKFCSIRTRTWRHFGITFASELKREREVFRAVVDHLCFGFLKTPFIFCFFQ